MRYLLHCGEWGTTSGKTVGTVSSETEVILDLRKRLADAIRKVDGFLYMGEAWALHEAVRLIPTRTDSPVVVEIGSWQGRSTIALALGAKARGGARVYAIDPHNGVKELEDRYGVINTYDALLRNLSNAGVRELVQPIRETSHQARSKFADQSVNLIFIDGSHEFDDVIQDIADWTPALAKGAAVVFNDPSIPGVYRALVHSVLRRGNPFRRARLIENSLFFSYEPAAKRGLADTIRWLGLRLVLGVRFRALWVRPYMPSWLAQAGHKLSNWLVGGSVT
jgi:predicted O-methyltransferase YrrM